MDIYLDNAATTRAADEIAEKLKEILTTNYGNPSSPNLMGIRIEREIKEATDSILKSVRLRGEMYFTSGGTESNNLAIFGAVAANSRKRKRIVTTKGEHPSVAQCMKRLEDEGFEVRYVGVDENGAVLIDELKAAVTDDTVLVSVMHVNNETGAVNDITEIGKFLKGSGTLFHSDGVQGFGKLECKGLSVVDLYSMSAHKIHGLKGVGGLYVKSGTRILPFMYGGGQQDAVRPGTENTAGIVTFGIAARIAADRLEENYLHAKQLRDRLGSVTDVIEGVKVNGKREAGSAQSPYILNMSFEGVKSEVLLHALEEDGIYASNGAACGSKKKGQSAMESMGFDSERAGSAIRFSFSRMNRPDEIDRCLESLEKNVNKMRRIKRG